jgi:hypothetical protein
MILAIITALPGLLILGAFGWGMVEDHRYQRELGNRLVADAIQDAYLTGLQAGWDDNDAEPCIEQS